MKRRSHYFLTILLMIVSFYSHAQSKSDSLMGDYEGIFTSRGKYPLANPNSKCVAEVFPVGNNGFFIHFLGAFNSRAEEYARTIGSQSNLNIVFNDEVARGEIRGDSLTGELLHQGSWVGFRLKKVERSSPTIGVKPTPGAIVLFDGSGFNEWEGEGTMPVQWKIVNGDEVEVVPRTSFKIPTTDIHTKHQFTDLCLHLEFKLSLMAESTGQLRSNSGVIFRGIGELQILDSYGLDGNWGECGSVYRQSPPKVNMCEPLLKWQTYDIIFHSPKYDADGRRINYANITVFHNGKRIHHQEPMIVGPGLLENGKTEFPVSISLQDHLNVLWFRNIWAIDLTENAELPDYLKSLNN